MSFWQQDADEKVTELVPLIFVQQIHVSYQKKNKFEDSSPLDDTFRCPEDQRRLVTQISTKSLLWIPRSPV